MCRVEPNLAPRDNARVVDEDREIRFPEHEYPSDIEIWLEGRAAVMIRHGMKFIELSRYEARDLGLALIELADAD
jgi:hypothetical protein